MKIHRLSKKFFLSSSTKNVYLHQILMIKIRYVSNNKPQPKNIIFKTRNDTVYKSHYKRPIIYKQKYSHVK